MYDFIDLNGHDITGDAWLSPEAVTVDGVTLDQVIPEFTTLQVTGRELVGYSLTTVTVGNQDGSTLQKKRREPRKITVKYQIDAETPQRFREIYYKLNQILSGETKKSALLMIRINILSEHFPMPIRLRVADYQSFQVLSLRALTRTHTQTKRMLSHLATRQPLSRSA